jgi:predicted RNase H-like HicB family nuclease
MRFVVLLHKDPGSVYGVTVPDLPGCVSAGETADEALAAAVEAIALHVEGLEAEGQPVPAPRTIEALLADPSLEEERAGATLATVPLVRDRGRPVRVNISMESGLLEAVDNEARARGMTRSAFIAGAVRNEIVGA